MKTQHPSSRTQLPRQIMRLGAWVLLAAIALSAIAAIPAIHDQLVTYPKWDTLSQAGQTVAILAAAVAWIAAVWHAVVDEPRLLPKPVLVALLVITNLLGGF